MRRAGTVLLLGVLAHAAPSAADPPLDWMLHCRGCHGADAAGVAGSVPRLDGEVARFLDVPGGRAFLIRVPGVAQSELNDQRLAALLTWMVGRFGPAASAAAATPFGQDEVAELRRRPLTRVGPVRAALLRAIQERNRGAR